MNLGVLVRAIATIDKQPGSETVAVWLTAREGLSPRHTNAVVMNTSSDPDATRKVYSLTRRSVVLTTGGSDLTGLPVEGEVLTAADIVLLAETTRERQEAIRNAITAFKRGGGSASHRAPSFVDVPGPTSFVPLEDTPAHRALATANYFSRVWKAWLLTDEERRRRTARPRTGETPWIMPEDLNQPVVLEFPENFAARAHEQALV